VKRTRIIESGKWVFAIVGASGFASCLSVMHYVLATLSLTTLGGTWYALYLVTEVEE